MAKKRKADAPELAQKKAEEMRQWRKEMKEARKTKKQEVRLAGNAKRAESSGSGKGRQTASTRQAFAASEAPAAGQEEPTTAKTRRKNAAVDAQAEPAQKKKKERPEGEEDEEEPQEKRFKKRPEVDSCVRGEESISMDPEAFKVVVAGIPFAIEEPVIRRDFSDCGEIMNLRLLRDRETKKSRGIAFISFTSQAALDAALEFNGTDYAGRALTVLVANRGPQGAGAEADGKGKGKGKSKASQGPGEKPAGCTSVIVKGLAYSVTDADLMTTFRSCGDGPSNVNILTDRETCKSRGMAFVDFDSEAAVDEAIKLNHTELKGRRFTMDYATPRERSKGPGQKPSGCTSVVVKGLDYSVTDADLMRAFKKCGGGPTNVRIAMDSKTGMSRGIAFVDFDSELAVDEAIKLHGSELKGRRFIMDYTNAAPREAGDAASSGKKGLGLKPSGCTSVVLRGLADSVTEAHIMKTFRKCGEGPRNVNIVMDKDTGLPKGVAFVNFASEAAVDEAIKLNGTELKGQSFTMGYVKPREKSSASNVKA